MHRFTVLLSVIFCVMFGGYMWVFELGLSQYLTVITVLPTLAMAPLIMFGGRDVVFSPMFIIYFMVLFANTLRYFVLSFNTEYFVERYHLNALTLEELTSGAEIFLCGVVALTIGYFVKMASKRPAHQLTRRNILPQQSLVALGGRGVDAVRKSTRNINLTSFVLVLSVFLLVLVPYLHKTGFLDDFSTKRVLVDEDGVAYRFGASRFAIAILTIVFQIVLVYSRTTNFKHALLVSLVAFLCVVFLGLALSKRSLLLASLLPVVLLYLRQIDFGSNLKIAVICALMLCVAAIVTIERKDSQGNHDGYVDRMSSAGREVFLSANFSGFVATAISTVVIKEELDPFWGSTYLFDPIAQFIPRGIWTDKPEELGGRLRQHLQASGFAPNRMEVGGVAPGLIGEAWLNFRLPGVFLVLFLVGYAFGSLFNQYQAGKFSDPFGQAAYLCYLPNITIFLFGGHLARGVIMSVMFWMAIEVAKWIFPMTRPQNQIVGESVGCTRAAA